MTSQPLHQRLQALADNLSKDQDLLKEYEDELRYENDPGQKAKYRRRIEELKTSVTRYRQEYDDLLQQVNSVEQSGELRTVATQLQQMDDKLDLVLYGQFEISQGLGEMRQALLSRYDVSERNVIGVVVQQLTQNQLAVTQAILNAIEADDFSEVEIRQVLAAIEEEIPQLPAEQARVAEIIKDPGLDAKHKLKVTLPIIPFIIDYEGELELGSGFNIRAAWKSLEAKLKKK